jgi:aspartate aminotransferase
MSLSKKGESISPSSTLVIDAKAKKMKSEGVDVIGFGAGEPDFNTPEHIKKAAIEAINSNFTRYTPASGIMQLKEGICNKFKSENGLEYTTKNVVVSNGAKHSLINTFQAILNPGDEVIVPIPYWVSYPEMIKMADGVPVFLETTEEQGFKFTIEMLKNVITSKTKAIIINSPSNPTGMVYKKEELEEIGKVALENDMYIVSDEIYEKLIYDNEQHTSIASINEQVKDRTIIINGVSKSYAMTGWRIGYTVANEKISKIMSNIQSHAASNPNSIAQKAALAAITGPQESVESMRKEFSKRRDYMVETINNIENVSCLKPTGAFYVMMNISKLIGKSVDGKNIASGNEFVQYLLEKAKVAVVPGAGFGVDNYVRLSYATSMENIINGLKRIEEFVKSLEE